MHLHPAADARCTTVPLPVSRWAVWDIEQKGRDGEKLDLAFVEPMLRRRLSPIARAAFHVANVCAGGLHNLPLVYASRHGELDRTVELLHAMATGDALSPTTFGLSVLNANAGLYSIARGETAPATALAANSETFGFGLLEAWSRMQLTNAPILYLYADAPLPLPLTCDDAQPSAGLAVGMLLDPGASSIIQCSMEAAPIGQATTGTSQAAAFLDVFQDNKNAAWTSHCRTWRWSH